jgi:hypothetical protein
VHDAAATRLGTCTGGKPEVTMDRTHRALLASIVLLGGTATITRDGDTLSITVDKPSASISISK